MTDRFSQDLSPPGLIIIKRPSHSSKSPRLPLSVGSIIYSHVYFSYIFLLRQPSRQSFSQSTRPTPRDFQSSLGKFPRKSPRHARELIRRKALDSNAPARANVGLARGDIEYQPSCPQSTRNLSLTTKALRSSAGTFFVHDR